MNANSSPKYTNVFHGIEQALIKLGKTPAEAQHMVRQGLALQTAADVKLALAKLVGLADALRQQWLQKVGANDTGYVMNTLWAVVAVELQAHDGPLNLSEQALLQRVVERTGLFSAEEVDQVLAQVGPATSAALQALADNTAFASNTVVSNADLFNPEGLSLSAAPPEATPAVQPQPAPVAEPKPDFVESVQTFIGQQKLGPEVLLGVVGGAAVLAGLGGGGGSSPSGSSDTTRPTLVITDDKNSVTNGVITYTFTFSEPVSGFTSSDISVTNGTKGVFSGSGSVYTLLVTPFANFEGNVTVAVGSSVAVDAANNGNLAATSNIQAVDTKAPAYQSMTIHSNGGVAGAATLKLIYDSALDASNIPPNNAFAVTINTVSNPVTNVTVAGNTVTLTLQNSVSSGAVTVGVTYTDPTGLDDNAAIQDAIGNDAVSLSVTSGIVADGYIRGAQMYLDAPGGRQILSGVVTDSYGNFFVPTTANPNAYALIAVGGVNIDTGLPNTIDLKAPAGSTTINPLTTLVQAFIVANPGTSVSVAASSVATALGITLPEGASLTSYDPISAGNLSAQKAAAQIATVLTLANTVDGGADTVVGNIVQLITEEDSIGLDFTGVEVFDSLFDGLDGLDDVLVGLAEALVAIANAERLDDISAAQGSYLDNVAPEKPNQPVLLESSDLGEFGNDNVTSNSTPTLRVAFDVSSVEGKAAVVGDVLKLYSSNTEVAQHVLTETDIANGYADLTVSSSLTDSPYVFSASIVDKAGNTGVLSDASAIITIDTTAPTVTISDNKGGIATGTIKYTFTFSEPVYGFDIDDIWIIGTPDEDLLTDPPEDPLEFSPLVTIENGKIYTLEVTPKPGFKGDVSVDIPAARVKDLAGNDNTAATPNIQVVDTNIDTSAVLTNFDRANLFALFDGNPNTTGETPTVVFSGKDYTFANDSTDTVDIEMTLTNAALSNKALTLVLNDVTVQVIASDDPQGARIVLPSQQGIEATLSFAGQRIGTFQVSNLDDDELLVVSGDSQVPSLDLKIASIIAKATNGLGQDAFDLTSLSVDATAELAKALIRAVTHNLTSEQILTLAREVLTLPNGLDTLGEVATFVQSTFTHSTLSALTFADLQARAADNIQASVVLNALALLADIAPNMSLSDALTKIAGSSAVSGLSITSATALLGAVSGVVSVDAVVNKALDVFKGMVALPDSLDTLGELAAFVTNNLDQDFLSSITLDELEAKFSGTSVGSFFGFFDEESSNATLWEVLTSQEVADSDLSLTELIDFVSDDDQMQGVTAESVVSELLDAALEYIQSQSNEINTLGGLVDWVASVVNVAPGLSEKTFGELIDQVRSLSNSSGLGLVLNAVQNIGVIAQGDTLSQALEKVRGVITSSDSLSSLEISDLSELVAEAFELTSESYLVEVAADLLGYALDVVESQNWDVADLVELAVGAVSFSSDLEALLAAFDWEALTGVADFDPDLLAVLEQIRDDGTIDYQHLIPLAAKTFLGSDAEIVFALSDMAPLNITIGDGVIDGLDLTVMVNNESVVQNTTYSFVV